MRPPARLSRMALSALTRFELSTKGLFFGCRGCGQCILSFTAYTCPMRCAKGNRNGPCGGVRWDGTCEVDPGIPCVWVLIWHRARKLRREKRLDLIQPQVDWRLVGTSSWYNHLKGRDAHIYRSLKKASS